jgi:hypothetical protein
MERGESFVEPPGHRHPTKPDSSALQLEREFFGIDGIKAPMSRPRPRKAGAINGEVHSVVLSNTGATRE